MKMLGQDVPEADRAACRSRTEKQEMWVPLFRSGRHSEGLQSLLRTRLVGWLRGLIDVCDLYLPTLRTRQLEIGQRLDWGNEGQGSQ